MTDEVADRHQQPDGDELNDGTQQTSPANEQVDSGDLPPGPLGLACKMVELLGHEDRQRLFDAIRFDQAPPQTRVERRLERLLALAEMLAATPLTPGLEIPELETRDYDSRRPEGAPTANRLADEFQGWWWACNAAYGLRSDGRSTRPVNAWAQPLRKGRMRMPKDYKKKDMVRALQWCRDELGFEPTSNRYFEWAEQKRRHGITTGKPINLPTRPVLYRLFPASEGGYAAACARAFGTRQ